MFSKRINFIIRHCRIFLFFFVSQFLISFSSYAVFSNYPTSNYWITNGTVRDIIVSGNSVFLGGDFTYLGPNTGYGALMSATTAAVDKTFPLINGTVYAAVPDNSGGWYIGGEFSKAGYKTKDNVVHILSDGGIDPDFKTSANGAVTALALAPGGDTLYLGGDFTSVSSTTRKHLAAIDIPTSTVKEWDPEANNTVISIAVSPDGDTIYAGGSFTVIGSLARNRIAAINSSDGIATSWNPNASNYVNTVAVSSDGAIVFAGGAFTTVGGAAKKYFTAINASDGTPLSWSADANGIVNSFALSSDGTLLYICGAFTTFAGSSRKHAAAIMTSDGSITAWDPPSSNGQIQDIAISSDGASIFICGDFTIIDEVTKNYLAALRTSDAALLDWSPRANNKSYTIEVSNDGSNVFAGGLFNSVGGYRRNYIAAIDTLTDSVASWNPSANNSIYSIEISKDKDTVYCGGLFTEIGGSSRKYIAEVDITSGVATDWDPSANANVLTMDISPTGTSLFVGGQFTAIGGASRNYLAALSPVSGDATNFNPTPDGYVYSLKVSADGKILYIGGAFKNVSTKANTNVAAIDATLAVPTSWNVTMNGTVYSLNLSPDGSMIYLGGAFTTVAGQNRSCLASLQTSVATPSSWNPSANNYVYETLIPTAGSTIFAGGKFSKIGSNSRPFAAQINTANSSVSSWNPILDGNIYALAVSTDQKVIYAGGAFQKVNSFPCAYFAAFRQNYYHLTVNTGSGDGDFLSGASVAIEADIPSPGYYFDKWTGSTTYVADTSASSTTVTMPASNISVTANYKIHSYDVTFTAGPNGTLRGRTTQAVKYGSNSSSVTAVPAADYKLDSWTGTGGFTSTENPLVVTYVTEKMDIMASFIPASPTANLTMASSPAAGGTTVPSSGTTEVIQDRPIPISASASSGYHFVNWTGTENATIENADLANTTVIISDDAAVTANFAVTPAQANLSMDVFPLGAGTTDPSGTTTWDTGESLSITAYASEGYYFLEWSSDSGSAIFANSLAIRTSLTIYDDVTVTAKFAAIPAETDVTYGKIYNLKASDVPFQEGQFLVDFARTPHAYGGYTDPITLKNKKASMRVATSVKIPVDNVTTEWMAKIALLDKKIWTQNKTSTCEEILNENPPSPLPSDLKASAQDSEGNKVKDADTGINLSETFPEIEGVYNENGEKIHSATTSQSIIVKGSFFGKSVPSVWLEYKDSKENVKKLNLKTERRNLAFVDVKGKPSCMNINTGQSQITVYMPGKWPKGWTHVGNHNIVIDNRICRATTSFQTYE